MSKKYLLNCPLNISTPEGFPKKMYVWTIDHKFSIYTDIGKETSNGWVYTQDVPDWNITEIIPLQK